MEYNTFPPSPQPEEIVLTYRQSDQITPVELRLERPLPDRMRLELKDLFPAQEFSAAVEGPSRRRQKRPMSRRKKVVVGLVLLAALIALGLGLWLAQDWGGNDPGNQDEDDPPSSPYSDNYSEDFFEGETCIAPYRPEPEDIIPMELLSAGEDAAALTPKEIYEKLSPATVTVLGEGPDGYGVGTGIIISADGYILTNYHVIAGCDTCYVWVTDEYNVDDEYPAYLVGGNMDQDLAVLKIMAFDLPVAELGVSDDLDVGDPVYAIGNPLGLELRGTFTDGIVSAVNRDVDVDGVTMTLIQTNAELNSGNSGGPLINQYGQVVGINTIKMMSGYENTVEGLGFAIPTSLAVNWINEILETGEIAPQPVLGVSINRIPVTLPDGTIALEVVEVTSGLGAEKAGIQVGDCIISFNGQKVGRTEDVLAIRRSLSVGDQVPVLLWRDGEYLEVTMEMMEDLPSEIPPYQTKD